MLVSFFILNNTSQGIFGGELFRLFLLMVDYLSWPLTVLVAKGGNTVYTSDRSWMFWFLLQRDPVCCMNTSKNKLEHALLVRLALKEEDFFAG